VIQQGGTTNLNWSRREMSRVTTRVVMTNTWRVPPRSHPWVMPFMASLLVPNGHYCIVS